MTAYTAAVTRNGAPMKDERIEDIHDLTYLRKYACQRYRYCGQDWYLKCVDCKNKCKAGLQAIVIMDNETKAAEKVPDLPVDKKKQEVIDIFESKDPVRYMLEHSGNIKPQSVYAKVSVMKKNYPDLDKKYHMLEKFRFLYTVPYASMKIPDILAQMYPDTESKAEPKSEQKCPDKNLHPEKEDFGGKYADIRTVGDEKKPEIKELPPTKIAPNSKVYSVKPADLKEDSEDTISLEDFLERTDRELREHLVNNVIEKMAEKETDSDEEVEKSLDDHFSKKKKEAVSVMKENSIDKTLRPGFLKEMNNLISDLEMRKRNLQKEIQQIDDQIKAVQTTMELMKR